MPVLCFRFHRGGFKESMETKKTFVDLYHMFYYIVQNYCLCETIRDVSLEFYSFDERINSYTFIVCVKNLPCGFMWFEL